MAALSLEKTSPISYLQWRRLFMRGPFGLRNTLKGCRIFERKPEKDG
jgi:hypothetical protein